MNADAELSQQISSFFVNFFRLVSINIVPEF
jgi:hypothetical protein